MISGEIKTKIDKIWTDIWANGITNPITVVEQLTYLLFIRSLDETEKRAERFESKGLSDPNRKPIFPKDASGQELRWSVFKQKSPDEMFRIVGEKVFPFMKTLNRDDGETAFSRYVEDATFLIPTPQALAKIVRGLDNLYEEIESAKERDLQGDLYEYMLGKLSTAGQNGQFRTPKHIRAAMAEWIDVKPSELICDPACGTAGFLISAAEYLRREDEKKPPKERMTSADWDAFAGPAFTGFDTDRTMLRLSAMNLALHSITTPEIRYLDSVSKDNEIAGRFDVILANPPFKGTVDKERIALDLKSTTGTTKTELLFVALFLHLLKKGGRCACVVPDGVLFGSSKAHKTLRRELVEKHDLRGGDFAPVGRFQAVRGRFDGDFDFRENGRGRHAKRLVLRR